MSTKLRDPYIDNAKFILVALVVIGHMTAPYRSGDLLVHKASAFLALVRMPALIFLTGYFSKGFAKAGYYPKVFKRVLIPYLIFQILISVYISFLHSKPINVRFLWPQYTLWFLLSLTFWNCLLPIFQKIKKPILVSIFFALIIGFFDHAGHYLSLSRTVVFFPFFLLGSYATAEHIELIKGKISPLKALSLIILPITLIVVLDPKLALQLGWGRFSYTKMGLNPAEGVLLRGAIMISSVAAAVALLRFVPRGNHFFTALGSRTAYIYLLHGQIVRTLYHMGFKGWFSNYTYGLVAAVITGIGLSFFLSSNLVIGVTRPIVTGEVINSLGRVYHRLKRVMPGPIS